MNTLLIFFALPIAVIIISIALQKIFRNPILVALIIFSIFLVITFVIGNLNILVLAIAYAILSFLTAYITYIICRILRSQKLCCDMNNNNNNCNSSNNNNENNNINNSQVLGTNGISARINIIPNNNQQAGTINGCYRRN